MTDSRDGTKTNKYPGEVRAGELNFIRNTMEKIISEDGDIDAIIFTGDFNIDLSTDLHILKGEIPGIPRIDTGVSSQTLNWGKTVFHEAFEGTHKWGVDFRGNICTAISVKRCSWIDLMWYTKSTLKVEQLSTNISPTEPIPNSLHGSDHLPITAVFQFLDPKL